MAAPQPNHSRDEVISEITARFSSLSTAEPTYSRDEAVSEVTSFYEFLVTLYLPDDAVVYPPDGGWTQIHAANITPPIDDTVLDLLRHLPYIRQEDKDDPYPIYPHTIVVDYTDEDFQKHPPWEPGITSELTSTPPHVAQLAYSKGRDGFYMFLDTKRGTITLCDFMYGPRPRAREFPVPKNYSQDHKQLGLPEEDWRECETYSIRDFFELLKNEFRVLDYIVTSPSEIYQCGEDDAHTEQIMRTYREFGWPGEGYKKKECQEKLREIEHARNLGRWASTPGFELPEDPS